MNAEAQAGFTQLKKRMAEALDGLRLDHHEGSPCWCGVAIGNPMLRGEHTQSCKDAHELWDAINPVAEIKKEQAHEHHIPSP